MKTRIVLLTFLLLLFRLVSSQPISWTESGPFTLDSKLPLVTVAIPNGGEAYGFQELLTVEWNATDESLGANPVSVAISIEEGGNYTVVASGLPNSGTAMVTPPGIATTNAKVKIVVEDDFGLSGSDESNDFFTFLESYSYYSSGFVLDSKPPLVDLLKPVEGDSYPYGDPLKVKWDASDDSFGPNPISISLSTDGGATYTSLATNIPDTDSALLTVPEIITDQAKIKIHVQDQFGLTAEDLNNGFFSLDGILLDLKAWLEGPFAGNMMLAYLNFFNFIPLSQPYSGIPWNYSGTESVQAIPNADVVDWVLVELRDAPSASLATPATRIDRRAAFLLEDGQIKSLDGSNYIQIGKKVIYGLYALVTHRNHLAVMSANELTKSEGIYSYDFTTSALKAYGGASGHKQIVTGQWGMISGDGNGDGQVNTTDKMYSWWPQSGSSGYKSGDFNMDGNVNQTDKVQYWKPNSGRSSQVPQ